MLRELAASATLIVVSASSPGAAKGSAHVPWAGLNTVTHCLLQNRLSDDEGRSRARVVVTWSKKDGYELEVSISGSLSATKWQLDSMDQGTRNPVLTGKGWHLKVLGEAGELAKREVAAGRELALSIEFRGRTLLFTSGAIGVANAMSIFDQCIAEINARPEPPPPPPRWEAETQGGRHCSIRSSGIPGLEVSFGSSTKMPLNLRVYAKATSYKDGGVMRIVLPGDPTPFTYDTTAPSATPDPRTRVLYAAIKSLKPVDVVFTPRGAKPVATRLPTEGLAAASAMFDACTAALKNAATMPQLSFSELRYVVNSQDDLCELTATFQIDGNAIWLTLVSDGKTNTFKVARRPVNEGYLINWLGLERLGGPKKLAAQDATFELDAEYFAALRRDILANGRDFHIEMSTDRSYTAQFGGVLATVEAPMFEACAHAKFDTR